MEFEVIDQDVPNILVLNTYIELNSVQRVDHVDVDKNELFEMHSDIFDGLGCITNIQNHINIDQSHKPVIHPP